MSETLLAEVRASLSHPSRKLSSLYNSSLVAELDF